MAPLRICLCLIYLFVGKMTETNYLTSSAYVRQDSGFVSANVGDSVTMRCFYEGDAVKFYWYKQTLGQKVRLISTFYKHEKIAILHKEYRNNSRFTLHSGNGTNHLAISNLRISDSATYYCTGLYAFDFEFEEGITVSVRGSGLNIPALVHQSDAVTLNCTVHTGSCGGEHRVYWFKTSEESHPGLIYTHGGKTDQSERESNTQTHTCAYNLPMKSVAHADTCAVVSCGHVLFGDRTKLDFKETDSYVLVYFLIGAFAFITILVILLAYAAYVMNNRNSCQCTDSRSSPALTPHPDNQDSDNLHYAAVREHKANRSTRQRDDRSECVYSSVAQ